MLPPELREAPPGPVDPVIQEKVALIDQVQRQKGVTVMSQLSKDRRCATRRAGGAAAAPAAALMPRQRAQARSSPLRARCSQACHATRE
jgi:hypothetical protein